MIGGSSGETHLDINKLVETLWEARRTIEFLDRPAANNALVIGEALIKIDKALAGIAEEMKR